MQATCTDCNSPLTSENIGLDDERCQDCWESLCSKGWWEMIRAIEQIGPENFYCDWHEEGDRPPPNHPEYPVASPAP